MKKRNMAITIAAVSAATSVAPALAFADTLDNQVIASTDAKAVAQLKGEIQGLLNTKYTDDEDMLETPANAGQCVYTIKYNLAGGDTTKQAVQAGQADQAGQAGQAGQADQAGQAGQAGQADQAGQAGQADQAGQAGQADKSNEKTPELKYTEIKTMDDLNLALAKLDDENDYLNITVEDKGHNTINGQIVDWKQGTYVAKNADAAKDQANITTLLSATKEQGVTDVKKVDDNTVQLTLQNNPTPLTVKTGNTVISLENPEFKKDKMGNYLNEKGDVIPTSDIKMVSDKTNPDLKKPDLTNAKNQENLVVTGFEDYKMPIQAADKQEPMYFGVNYKAAIVQNYNASNLYNTDINRCTVAGNQIANFIHDYNNTVLKTDNKSANSVIDANEGTLTVTFPVDKSDEMDSQIGDLKGINPNPAQGEYAKIVIKGSNAELTGLKNAFDNKVAAGDIATIAGEDRYDTAVRVSKATFVKSDQIAANNKIKANSVVLVSGTALADGLTATPFAAKEKAPILLTGKDKVNDKTMDEIKRVLGKTGTIHVIGGENTISKDVETQLKAKGYTIDRIKGSDRYETSLEIAKAMESKLDGSVYVAGGYAEPDAMSIAPIAAKTGNTNPILLANAKTGLTADQQQYIEDSAKANATAKGAQSYIIGGADRAPEVIKTQIKDAGLTKVAKRLSGEDRQGTNAAVIKEFATADNMKNLYVGKSDNQGLVDSLSAGVLAGKNNAPILLATNSVNAEQQSVLKAQGQEATTKTQVGYGIAAQVWSTISDLFKN